MNNFLHPSLLCVVINFRTHFFQCTHLCMHIYPKSGVSSCECFFRLIWRRRRRCRPRRCSYCRFSVRPCVCFLLVSFRMRMNKRSVLFLFVSFSCIFVVVTLCPSCLSIRPSVRSWVLPSGFRCMFLPFPPAFFLSKNSLQQWFRVLTTHKTNGIRWTNGQ